MPPITVDDIEKRLDSVWNNPPKFHRVDWDGLEDTLVDILKLEGVDDCKVVALCKDTIDAFTRRGHFR